MIIQVPKHDARGDARQLAVEQLTSKSVLSLLRIKKRSTFPLYSLLAKMMFFRQFSPSDAHVIAAAFVDFYADVLHTNYVKYEVSYP